MIKIQFVKRKILFLFIISICRIGYSDLYIVSNGNSTGTGSLYWAITQTQLHSGPDTIAFNIAKEDPSFNGSYWEIFITNPLPTISDDGTIIDGSTQTRNLGNANFDGLELQLDGSRCNSVVPAFNITSSNNLIRDLAIGNFATNGVHVHGVKAHHNIIAGCHIGNDADGRAQLKNNGSGIACTNGASYNSIGGSGINDRNIISGNINYGVNLEESNSNMILGNYIGIDATGAAALPNGIVKAKYTGIRISYGGHNRIGAGNPAGRNVISGNLNAGILIENAGSDSNIVQGNYIGLGGDGRTAIPNDQNGLRLKNGANYNLIGGSQPGEANVISGNKSSGVQLWGNTHYNELKSNIIGMSASGILIVPNMHNGIYCFGSEEVGYPTYNLIGPENIICGNGVEDINESWGGISLDNPGTSYNSCFGNFIGVNPYTNIVSGQPTGVLIQRGAHHNTIGPQNIIASSYYNGVLVRDDNTICNKITRNQIFNNNNKAIENLNGGNQNLSPPEILSASPVEISGIGPLLATVELYASQNGQADTYIGTTQTNSKGQFLWKGNISRTSVVALAIDRYNNTSELSSSASVPVELASFKVEKIDDHQVRLFWCTASEQNNVGFSIEKTYQPGTFDIIAFINGCGTTSELHHYEFFDTIFKPGKYEYRLKQHDADGKISYSLKVSIDMDYVLPVLNIFPNPFNQNIKILFQKLLDQHCSVIIYNILGQPVRTLNLGASTESWQELLWNGCDDQGRLAPSGDYLITLKTSDNLFTQKCLLLR